MQSPSNPSEGGKRALAKRGTRLAIRRAAMPLFLEHGFDKVTTTQVAAAAEVSPATLFNYFGTKEDLFFGQVRQLERELVDVVRSCPPGRSIIAALQAHVLYELTAGRAQTKPEDVGTFHEQVARSPRLQAREHEIFDRREIVLTEALTQALGPDAHPLQARVAARLYVAAEKLVATELRDRLAQVSTAEAMSDIPAFIDQVFAIVADGLGPLASAGSEAASARGAAT